MSRLSFVRLSMFAVAPWLSIGAVALAETSPLVDAAKRGDSKLVVQLIHRGASVDATMADGATAPLRARYHADEATGQSLLEAAPDATVATGLRGAALRPPRRRVARAAGVDDGDRPGGQVHCLEEGGLGGVGRHGGRQVPLVVGVRADLQTRRIGASHVRQWRGGERPLSAPSRTRAP